MYKTIILSVHTHNVSSLLAIHACTHTHTHTQREFKNWLVYSYTKINVTGVTTYRVATCTWTIKLLQRKYIPYVTVSAKALHVSVQISVSAKTLHVAKRANFGLFSRFEIS